MARATGRAAPILAGTCLVLLCCRAAYGYVDPGTGSLILQVILGSLLGAAFAVKIFWRQIMIWIGRLFSKRHKDDANSE